MAIRTVNDNLDGGMIMILSWIIINFSEFSKQIKPPIVSLSAYFWLFFSFTAEILASHGW